MERRIATRRLYQLAPFNTLEVVDETINLPKELAFDGEFVKRLKYLQLVELEMQYYRYLHLAEELEKVDKSDRLVYLKQIKTNLFEELKTYLFDNTKKEN
jgi:hypothetical protein